MIETQYITLDMKPSGVLPVLYCSQYDIGRPLGMVVNNGAESVDLGDYTVTIEATRTDGVAIIAAVTTSGNIGAFETTATMTNKADRYGAQLVLSAFGKRVASLPFVMVVVKAEMDENAESIEEDASLYQQYTGTVQTLIANISANLSAGLLAEATARQNADQALQNSINAEATARQSADNALQADITAEATTRIAQDAVLQAQIDNFVALSEGSTTGDAELQNIRIGANGVTYPTAGNAVRSQITNVIDRIDYFINPAGKNVFAPFGVVDGILSGAGIVVIQGTAVTSDFLPVSSGTYTISVNGIRTAMRVICVYNSSKALLSRTTTASSVTVPSDGAYIRVSYEAAAFPEKTQIEKNDTPTAWEPYYEALNILPDIFKVNQSIRLAKASTILAGFYTIAGVFSSNNTIETRVYQVDYAGQTFYYTGMLAGSAGYPVAAFFDANMSPIGVDASYVSTSSWRRLAHYAVTVPAYAKYVAFPCANISATPFYVEKTTQEPAPDLLACADRFLGHLDTQGISESGYNHLISYGQSLSIGGSSLYVADAEVDGCSVLGSINTPSNYLGKLVLSANNQHPIVSATNSLATLAHKHGRPGAKFIASSYGVGSQTIAQLMSPARQAQIKTERGFDYDITTQGKWAVFTSGVDYAAALATATGETICCPAIVYLQGEADYNADTDSRHGYSCGGDKALYKKYMGWLKNDMQSYVMTAYGQTKKPVFYIYQCSGVFVANYTMSINMAQIEFAAENDDVVLLPCPYFTPNYGDGHLSTNGYRWFGEYIGKYIFEESCLRARPPVLQAADVTYDANHVYIDTMGGILPLVIDTYTVEEATQYGFKLLAGEVSKTNLPITDVTIEGARIILTTSSDIISYDWVEVTYAGVAMSPQGSGNIRDSARYGAMYTYWDDSSDTGETSSMTISHRPTDADGNSMVGKPYPMQNWLSPFYKRIV